MFVEHIENNGAQRDTEQRIDLIKFYNTIFVQIVRDNALKYSTNSNVSNQELYLETYSFIFRKCIIFNHYFID